MAVRSGDLTAQFYGGLIDVLSLRITWSVNYDNFLTI